jgi:formate dehydrogenase iron-sulfur subunit
MGQLSGRLDDVTADAGYAKHPPRMGFFTDTSVCIGCKACEVACKEWNAVPDDGYLLTGMSYDNTQELGASTWRHVAFVEKSAPSSVSVDLGMPGAGPPGVTLPHGEDQASESGDNAITWLMSSDVCKHCTHAACLDVCPTGSLFRTEFGTVVVQPDICNGCGYCVPACPYGVIDVRPEDGRAFKCTLCYDRLKEGPTPACAQACPTESIQFGELDALRERADLRLAALVQRGDPRRRAFAQLVELAELDRLGGARLGAGRRLALLESVVAQGALPGPAVALAQVDHAVGTRRHAVPAAVAHVGLHEHRVELGADQRAGRARVEAARVRPGVPHRVDPVRRAE